MKDLITANNESADNEITAIKDLITANKES